MTEDQQPERQPENAQTRPCRWRRTERRTRGAKEIELEIRLRERQRARRFADRGEQDRIRYLPVLPLGASADRPSYR
ncbi:hypothetical protein Caci_5886 [Catenulispora acidiphila DSM 44928]|uniref:Uncharacterized protein n=2 Tax=Catenulispora TaxID=414878 RepID=C7QEY6_CATAD|nr:hypothetical protein Caci_5886 [Catenulispora acidiphila DSM 44928]